MTTRPLILFLCVHNAGRSQMAAAFARRDGVGSVDVWSAGSSPSDRLHPVVVEAMREVGLDISSEVPRVLSDDVVRRASVVVTMGCGDACPYFPDKRYVDWELDDPAGKCLEDVRSIRDEIERRVRALVVELTSP